MRKYKRFLKKRENEGVLPANELAYSTVRPIIVFYDGWCPFCIQSVRKFRQLDWFNRIEFMSFREPNVVNYYQLNIIQLEKRMQSIKRSNYKAEEGVYSIIRICKNIPALWFLIPFLNFFSGIGLGQKVYDWLASRRTIFPTGGCEGSNCQISINTNKKQP